MIQLTKLGENPFQDSTISQSNFRQLSFDHLGKLKANNPENIYTVRIGSTQAAFDKFDTVWNSKTLEEAIRKGETFDLTAATGLVLTNARKLEKLVAFHFNNPSAQYFEFFPKGLTELNQAGKGDWLNILSRLKASTEKYKATLGDSLATEFATFQSEYVNSEEIQVGKNGSVNDFRTFLDKKRNILATEMFTNLLTIVLANIGNPFGILTYFDQSIVDRRQSGDSDGKGRLILVVSTSSGDMLPNVLYSPSKTKTTKTCSWGRKQTPQASSNHPPCRWAFTRLLSDSLATKSAPIALKSLMPKTLKTKRNWKRSDNRVKINNWTRQRKPENL